MGYYTRYSLSIIDGDKKLINEFRSEFEDANYALDENGYTNQECKWYNWADDLAKFSKKHKGVTFYLSGEGEESDDNWRACFKNGNQKI